LTNFQKNTDISNLMKIHPVGAGLFQRTDRHDEANICISQFFQCT